MPVAALPIAAPFSRLWRLSWWIQLILLSAVMLLTLQAGTVRALAESQLRTFTCKDGTSLNGRIIGLSSDGKRLIIRDLDDREQAISILELGLDDQQLIKDWQAVESGEANRSVNLSATVITKEKPLHSFREDQTGYRHHPSSRVYRLYIRNAGTLPTTTLSAEYCLLYWNKIAVYPTNDGSGTTWSAYTGKGRVHYLAASTQVASIETGGEKTLLTTEHDIDRLIADGETAEIGSDRPIGIRVRLVDPFGTVVAEHCDFSPAFAKLGWTALSVSRRRVKTDTGFRYLERGVLQIDHSAYEG